jgi:hypothetical protein
MWFQLADPRPSRLTEIARHLLNGRLSGCWHPPFSFPSRIDADL